MDQVVVGDGRVRVGSVAMTLEELQSIRPTFPAIPEDCQVLRLRDGRAFAHANGTQAEGPPHLRQAMLELFQDATLVEALEAHRLASQPGPEPRTTLTRLEFMQRFTEAEQGAIWLSQDPEVAVARGRAQMARVIDLQDCGPLLDMLVSKGLIAPEKKAQILVPA